MTAYHISVMLDEVISALNVRSGGIYFDGTLGGGGHSLGIMKAGGNVIATDLDEDAIKYAEDRFLSEGMSGRFTIVRDNFKNFLRVTDSLGCDAIDGAVLDLGVSSHQFDDGERGFSYRFDAELDMRMDRRQELTAEDVVNGYSEKELLRVLYEYGEESYAKSIVRNIIKARQAHPIKTTGELADIIAKSVPYRKGGHPAKKTFQALRIAVNDELNVFDKALKDALDILNVNGRIAVITFHSLEDKICKYTFNDVTKLKDVPAGLPVIPDYLQPKFKLVNKKPIVASKAELAVNHRAHSAKLRIIERVVENEA